MVAMANLWFGFCLGLFAETRSFSSKLSRLYHGSHKSLSCVSAECSPIDSTRVLHVMSLGAVVSVSYWSCDFLIFLSCFQYQLGS